MTSSKNPPQTSQTESDGKRGESYSRSSSLNRRWSSAPISRGSIFDVQWHLGGVSEQYLSKYPWVIFGYLDTIGKVPNRQKLREKLWRARLVEVTATVIRVSLFENHRFHRCRWWTIPSGPIATRYQILVTAKLSPRRLLDYQHLASADSLPTKEDQSKSKKRRMFLEVVTPNGGICKALVDTGANKSGMDRAMAERLIAAGCNQFPCDPEISRKGTSGGW